MMVNNIFYIEGQSKSILGDQYKPETKGTSAVTNILFKNNVFLRADNWPSDVLIQDTEPVFGNPALKTRAA